MIFEKKQFVSDATAAYVECLLWTETGDGDNPRPLDEEYGSSDIEAGALIEIGNDVADFVDANWFDVKGLSARQVGHDFALTRNGHGAGFWDRGLGDLGERLSDAARVYGSQGLSVSDDGKLYLYN